MGDIYKTRIKKPQFQLLLFYFQGWMETTAMFYGYYTNTELALAVSEYNMPLAYFIATILVLLISLIVMVRK